MSIAELIQSIVRPMLKNYLTRGEVISVNKSKNTCLVSPLDGGANFVGVKITASQGLNKGSLIIYPQEGSIVYVGFLNGLKADAFVAKYTDIDEIVFQDGENGGLCITPELVKQLNYMSKRIDRVYEAIQNAKPATGAPDSGTALLSSMNLVLNVPAVKEDFSKVENKKFKH